MSLLLKKHPLFFLFYQYFKFQLLIYSIITNFMCISVKVNFANKFCKYSQVYASGKSVSKSYIAMSDKYTSARVFSLRLVI